jgi:DNA-binding XRE family transcriptional regulator
MTMKNYVKKYLENRGLNETQVALAVMIGSQSIEEGEKEEIAQEAVAEDVYRKYKRKYG